MNMNKMGKLFLSALSVVSFAACAVGSTDEAVVLGESQDALTGPNGFGFFGSDTLFPAITQAILAWDPTSPLTYYGTGSGNGEKCLRGQAVGTYCNGSKDQTIAPMSRDFNGACQTDPVTLQSEKSNVIALDAVALWANNSQTVSNLTSANVKAAFCGTDGSGSVAACTVLPWAGAELYRRDDVSGTTDVFKTLNSCTGLCANVKIVVDDLTAGPRLSTDAPGTSSLVPVPCAASDSATKCLGKIAANDVDVLAYAGLDAATAGAKKLTINSIPANDTTIRYLVNGLGAPYPYARRLFLNDGIGVRDIEEQGFRDWALVTNKLDFENILTSHGFIACTDPADPSHFALDCGAGKCP
ncbi:hypothetical protein [Sorangium sp. So ce1000]|uniref:hypothetical protein n=1 Tax=Sorangium sp. So ce1000 TaxID=3133325 RepID=UPI003F5DA4B4